VTGVSAAGGIARALPAQTRQDVLDRVDEFADFDPHRHYKLTSPPPS